MTTPILTLDEMVQAQANPYLIFNEAARALEKAAASGVTKIVTDATVERTLTLSDWGAYIRMTSDLLNDVVVPDDATLGIEATDTFAVHVRMAGLGDTAFVASSDVVINALSLVMPEQHSTATLIHVGANEWDLIIGGTAAASSV